MKKVIILGVSADIGSNICKLFHADGFKIIGTYRKDFNSRSELESLKNTQLIQCDLTRSENIHNLANFVSSQGFKWTHLFSSVGTSEPIGRFFDLDFDDWEKSIAVNMTSQLKVIHSLYPLRDSLQQVSVALLAGGGTNNPFRCYSAYAVAKIGLIKMCELIDDETEDLNIFIVGPGFVRTKTHYETLNAGDKAESNFEIIRTFMDTGNQGTSFQDIYKCLQWASSMGREVAGGRNFSVVYDKWGTERLGNELKRDIDMYKLRRHKNNWK
jgi:NAD(P)-dependent dehydrogenase (short-subunit alcohol dehydrogenase family)